MKALIFDCDGVILESEELHRIAYNAAFKHFDVRCNGELVEWTEDYYNMLQNKVGGGKPKVCASMYKYIYMPLTTIYHIRTYLYTSHLHVQHPPPPVSLLSLRSMQMRWYFSSEERPAGIDWPSTSILGGKVATTDEERVKIIDDIQEWKSAHYQSLVASGQVPSRPGVLRLMDEARALGLFVCVCSAATKSSVTSTVPALIGQDRYDKLDVFLAGNDAPRK